MSQVDFVNSPTSVTVDPVVNNTFTVTIAVESGTNQTVDLVEIHLDFDPSLLQVQNLTPLVSGFNGLLPSTLGLSASNSNGTIDYVGATTSNFPVANFDFLEIEFQTIGTGNTSIDYSFNFPRESIITFDASNVLGNTNNISVQILSADNTPPVITLAGNNSLDLTVGDTYTDPGFSASDDVDGNLTSAVVVGGDVVNTSVVGTYIVTYNVSDAAGNDAEEKLRTVNVSAAADVTPPVITLVGNSTLNLVVGDTYTDPGFSASDDVDGNLTSAVLVGGDVVNTSVVGTYIVTYNVSDAAGNDAEEKLRTVNVSAAADVTPPVITLAGNSTLNLVVGDTYTDPGFSASDDVDGNLTSAVIVGGDVVNTSVVGTYIVTYNVSDAAGNAASEMRTINVAAAPDVTPPVITLFGDDPLNLIVGDTYTDPGFSASDDVDGNLTSAVIVGGDVVNTNVGGTYNVTYNVSDAAGNSATEVTREVIVSAVGNTDVIFVVNPAMANQINGQTFSVTVEVQANSQQLDLAEIHMSFDPATLQVLSLTPQATGVFPSSLIPPTFNNTAGTIDYAGSTTGPNFPFGTFDLLTIEFEAVGVGSTNLIFTDPSGAASTIATNGGINVLTGTVGGQVDVAADVTPPIIILLGDDPLDLTVGDTYTDPGATASDNVDGDLTGAIIVGGNVVNTSAAGTYVVTYNVMDVANNAAAEVTRTVNVLAPNTAPIVVIDAPINGSTVSRGTNITLSGTVTDAQESGLAADLQWSSGDVQFSTDPIDGVGNNITGQFVTPGSQTLTASVTDEGGLSGSDQVTVTVSGPEVTITAPAENAVLTSTDVTLQWTATNVLYGLTEHFHIFVNPPDLNNINTDTRISTASAIGQTFWDLTALDGIIEGSNTIVIRAANQFHDEFTNPEAQDIVNFTVNLPDVTPPVITLNGATTISLTLGQAYTELGATATDNVDGDLTSSIAIDASSLDVNTVGSYQVTYNVTDAANNMAVEVIRTVNVSSPLELPDPCDNTLYRINVGGTATASADATPLGWSQDIGAFGNAGNSEFLTANSTGGSTYSGNSGSAHPGAIIMTDPSVPTSAPAAIFNTERYDATSDPEMKWEFPVASGTEVQVTLLFAELFGSIDQAGERVFDVEIEGVVLPAFDNIDPFAIAGAKGAFTRSATITVTDGVLDIEFIHITENPALKGIQICDLSNPVDDTPPVIALIGDNPLELMVDDTYADPGFTASDDIDGDLTASVVVGGDAVNTAVAGSYSVTYNVSDAAGNPATEVVRTVNVTAIADVTPPVITLSGDNPLNLNVGDTYIEPNATALDNVDGDISGSIVINASAVNTAVAGIYGVTYNVSDAAGNPATPVTRQVIVNAVGNSDVFFVINPATVNQIDGLTFSLTVEVQANNQPIDLAEVHLSFDPTIVQVLSLAPQATGVFPASLISPTFDNTAGTIDYAGSTTGPTFPSGTFDLLTIEFQAVGVGSSNLGFIDPSGPPSTIATRSGGNVLTGTVDGQINITAGADLIPPVITLLGNNPLNLAVGDTYTDPGFTASDNVDGDLTTAVIVGGDAVNTAIAGTYNVTYNVSDAAGNPATEAVRTVNVSAVADVTPPVITLLGDNPLNLNVGDSYNEPNATAFDNVDGDISGSIAINATAVNTAVAGTYPVTYNVSDAAGNPATQVTRQVIVNDLVSTDVFFVVNPAAVSQINGQTFSVTVEVQANSQPLDLAEIHLSFNPAIVQVLSLTPQATGVFPSSLISPVFDNTAGTIDYAGSTTGPTFPSGTFDLLTIEFEAMGVGLSNLNFVDPVGPPSTIATRSGSNVLTGTVGGQITVTAAADLTPPVITLIGDNPLDLTVGDTYTDPGFTASDDVDGDLTAAVIVGGDVVNTSIAGTYVVTYNVMDAANNSAVEVTRTVNVNTLDLPCAYVAIDPSGNSLLTGSTFSNGLIITNNSQGNSQITSVSFDLSTAIYPNMVFDPVGTAGDATAKCLTITSQSGGDGSVGLTIPGNGGTGADQDCTTPFVGETEVGNGGYYVLNVNFNDFEPGETINFAIDIDPTNIEGFNSAGNAGAISGLELIGTTVTVEFSDGQTATSELYRVQPSSQDGAENYFYPGSESIAPGLSVLGAVGAANVPGFLDATVGGEDQIVQISGTPGDAVSLLILESTIEDVGPGIIPGPFEANKVQVVQELDAVIGAGGTVDIPVTLADNASGEIYHLVAVSARTNGGICGIGTSNTSEVWRLKVDPVFGDPNVLIEILPGAGLNASTFGGNSSFQITNQSTGNLQVTGVTFDLSTGILPDMVFDPTGSGGDATAQCFTAGGTAADVGLIAPVDPCADLFFAPRNGGFDALSTNFTDFNPGETFTFAVDVDPNSIQGVPGAGNAGAVSGYELVGATVTVTFNDGSTIVSSLYEDGSLGGSQAVVTADVPSAPAIGIVGLNTLPATVSDLNQTVTVSGTPGDHVSLLVMDSRLYIASGIPPFGVSDDTYYANEAMSGQALYTGIIGAGGTVNIPVTLLVTPSGDATPSGGLNQFIAVTSSGPYAVDQPVSNTSNVITLLYDPNAGVPDLTISVTRQGMPEHSGDYTVKLYQINAATPDYDLIGTADASGEIILDGIAPGTYEMAIKYPNCLQKVIPIIITGSGDAYNVGELRTGDVNDNNQVNILDFSALVTSFGLEVGNVGYNAEANLNGDNIVNILDFSLLVTNFNVFGELPSGLLP